MAKSKTSPKKEAKAKTTVPIQPVPEKRGYEFGGPFVVQILPASPNTN
jgi:hypothetical protein